MRHFPSTISEAGAGIAIEVYRIQLDESIALLIPLAFDMIIRAAGGKFLLSSKSWDLLMKSSYRYL